MPSANTKPDAPAPTLYLIDGYAQFFRAYHAIRTPMTSPVTGEPTNLTFGFVGMLLKLLRGEGNLGGPPSHIALALDVSGDRGTFRSELYPEYKANRPPPPEDLKPQVQRCLALLAEIGVPAYGVEGFEADDVAASIVREVLASDSSPRVRIVSKDKDLKQLLAAGRVELFDVHTDQPITEADLFEDSGITPSQVIDMLALMGDTVDNVPGVEGIGPKTAAKLIAEHGTLDGLLAQADSITGKRGENIRAAADRLALSRELVTLKSDVETGFSLDECRVETLQLEALMPFLKELGFNRYQDELKRLMGLEPEPAAPEPKTSTTTGADSVPPGGFGGLFDQPGSSARSSPDREPTIASECVTTKKQLAALVKALNAAPVIAIDTETTGLSPLRSELCGISFATEPGSGWYVPVRAPEGEETLDVETALDALRPIIEDAAKPKIGHNLKFDLLVLRHAGVELRGFDALPVDGGLPGGDTMVASYLIDATRSSHKLDALALALLQHECIPIKELIGSGKSATTFDTVPLARAAAYAAEDAEVTLRLAQAMFPQLEQQGLGELSRDLEMPLVGVLAELEWNGILVDPDELRTQRDRLASRIDELKKQLSEEADTRLGWVFEPDSPKQLSAALFNPTTHDERPGLALKPIKKTKTGYSTDAEVLEKLAQDPTIETPIPGLVLEYRQLAKLVGTYLESLKDEINDTTRRIHASFNQTVAATGRLSSSDPNLQNIPIRTDLGREIRRAFVAPDGRVLISADYSQIELRLLAHLSDDPNLIAAFNAGEDIHRAVASEVHGVDPADVTSEQRSGAKMVNFGIVYGITAFGLARRLGVGNAEAQDIIDAYKKRFARITTFLHECVEHAKSHGFVQTMLGRRRPIPEIDSKNPARRALAERTAINTVVQGSAADLIKLAMLDLHRRLSAHATDTPELSGVEMLLQIHDELVFEAPEGGAEQARDLIVKRMEVAMDLNVPLVADSSISRDWFGGKH
ncbi:MAG: DNA polymerase I [Planctomycetota bacterium]